MKISHNKVYSILGLFAIIVMIFTLYANPANEAYAYSYSVFSGTNGNNVSSVVLTNSYQWTWTSQPATNHLSYALTNIGSNFGGSVLTGACGNPGANIGMTLWAVPSSDQILCQNSGIIYAYAIANGVAVQAWTLNEVGCSAQGTITFITNTDAWIGCSDSGSTLNEFNPLTGGALSNSGSLNSGISACNSPGIIGFSPLDNKMLTVCQGGIKHVNQYIIGSWASHVVGNISIATISAESFDRSIPIESQTTPKTTTIYRYGYVRASDGIKQIQFSGAPNNGTMGLVTTFGTADCCFIGISGQHQIAQSTNVPALVVYNTTLTGNYGTLTSTSMAQDLSGAFLSQVNGIVFYLAGSTSTPGKVIRIDLSGVLAGGGGGTGNTGCNVGLDVFINSQGQCCANIYNPQGSIVLGTFCNSCPNNPHFCSPTGVFGITQVGQNTTNTVTVILCNIGLLPAACTTNPNIQTNGVGYFMLLALIIFTFVFIFGIIAYSSRNSGKEVIGSILAVPKELVIVALIADLGIAFFAGWTDGTLFYLTIVMIIGLSALGVTTFIMGRRNSA